MRNSINHSFYDRTETPRLFEYYEKSCRTQN